MTSRWTCIFAGVLLLATACKRAPVATSAAPTVGPESGTYWARLADIPEGMRVRVHLERVGPRVRGWYVAQPWEGSLEGLVQPDGALLVQIFERGVTQAVGSRDSTVRLAQERNGQRFIGQNDDHQVIELLRAPTGDSRMRPGVWLAHWTGLPFGLAAETRITRDPDGHFRAQYQYRSSGAARDGSFDGQLGADQSLALEWTETSDGNTVARGRASLQRALFGLRGTYGIEGHATGVGEWILEPLSTP
ncbi:MAG: hypothetical protein Q8Q09_02490 [Deltaproteobacteria bacterium]|nr:hypothetical protein [Deltaproteobacteria bacterium]